MKLLAQIQRQCLWALTFHDNPILLGNFQRKFAKFIIRFVESVVPRQKHIARYLVIGDGRGEEEKDQSVANWRNPFVVDGEGKDDSRMVAS
jgi:hypothetical protein